MHKARCNSENFCYHEGMSTLLQTPFGTVNPWIAGIVIVWIMVWKGLALWKSARLSHPKWFVVILIVNTFGILEIIYLYFIARKFEIETIESPATSDVK